MSQERRESSRVQATSSSEGLRETEESTHVRRGDGKRHIKRLPQIRFDFVVVEPQMKFVDSRMERN